MSIFLLDFIRRDQQQVCEAPSAVACPSHNRGIHSYEAFRLQANRILKAHDNAKGYYLPFVSVCNVNYDGERKEPKIDGSCGH